MRSGILRLKAVDKAQALNPVHKKMHTPVTEFALSIVESACACIGSKNMLIS